MRCITIVLACVLMQLSVAAAQDRAPAGQAVQVYREPFHQPVFQNALVRVLDVRVPAGDTTAYHVHANHHLAVVILGARTWDQRMGDPAASAVSAPLPVGSVFDNAGDTIPYTHRVGNADTTAFRYVVAQILAPSGAVSDVLSAGSGLDFDRETMGARIYRVTLEPGQSTPRHRHGAPGLTVQIGAGKLRIDGTSPAGHSRGSGAGAWWWRGEGAEHTLRNIGPETVDVVEIDWP
jgi:quercetin dioxygenase-like cupin family protein